MPRSRLSRRAQSIVMLAEVLPTGILFTLLLLPREREPGTIDWVMISLMAWIGVGALLLAVLQFKGKLFRSG